VGLGLKSIVWKELKLLLKGKGNFFFLIIMPALFIVLFGSVFSGAENSSIKVNYVDQDHSAISQKFIQSIAQVKGFEVQQDASATLSDQIQQIKSGKLSTLVVIPAGFGSDVTSGKPANIEFYRDVTADTVAGPVASVLNGIAGEFQKQHIQGALIAAGQSPGQVEQVMEPPLQIKEIKESGSGGKVSMIDQIVPGYTVMFVFFILMNMMRSFLGEKETGMLSRLRSTPMRPMTYLLGMWIPAIIAVLVQCIVLLGFGHFVYHVDLGNLDAISLLVFCLAICGTGIGLAVSFLVRGENQGRGITMLITLGGAALGGVWLPTDLMPHFAQVIGYFTPQYWAQKGFLDVMIRGANIPSVWESLLILIAFGLLGLIVALWRFRSFMRTATN
jgi:ABC-2 type transport system permease protein